MPLSQALREAGTTLPPVRPIQQRRLELSQMGDRVPAPVRIMFSLGEGKSRMVADPQGRAFFVVKVDKITPGNALLQPTLISQVQNEFQTTLAQEYARQFVEAMRAEVTVRRKDSAIAAARKRLTGG
jgi:peptidyl-prolyl cis-trans isomerase D